MTKADILAASGSDKHFTAWLNFELDHEDVTRRDGTIICENVSGDSGGQTFAGIDRAAHPNFPYDNPTPADVVAEYLKDWNRVRAGELPHPVGAVVANYGVNMGTIPAVKLLQLALAVPADGGLGTITISAASKADPIKLALAVITQGDIRYEHLAGFSKFGKGWLNRNKDLRAFVESAA